MTLSTFIDFFHQLATVTWIGGIIYTNLVLMPSLPAIEMQERGKLVGAIAKRFTIFAWLSIVVLILTGIMKASSEEMANISQTEHTILTIKYVLFALMFFIGIIITFVLGPKMKALTPKPGDKPSVDFPKVQKQLSTLAIINMILGIVVLFCVAL